MADRAADRWTVVGVVVVIAAVLGAPGSARAQGPYVGGSVGATDITVPILGGSSDWTTTYQLFLGYELPKYVGFEAAWMDLGTHEDHRVDNTDGTMHTQGWTAAVTGRIPTSEVFALYGKVGCFFWRTRYDVVWSWGAPIGAGTSTGSDLFWGAGVRFNVAKVSFLGEYDRYTTGDLGDHKAISFAVRYTF